MDMQPLQASFATQDQAESVIRKLASLRGDRFRLERASGNANQSSELSSASTADSDNPASSLLSNSRLEASEELTPARLGSSAEFTLSANVPGEATEQARTVILQAGGVIL
ncbi:hypothetical protein [Cohnella herbarum]|uniref:Uncharacterized protein n=1 Tax=Cohnella herbarum TaxID=2728023 RepID=A0A7Z2VIN7_9BACL|nr:hypothetical protein [Cohnella herbarum]QJD83665.1 hypothetical protein HH215_11080 [Cohnella herbarum]